MERSRRQRLNELYGDPVGYSGTPKSTKRLTRELSQHARSNIEMLPKEAKQTINPSKKAMITQQPLISSNILDIGSQKAFVLALFVIIQAYKLYDLILFKNNMPISSLLGLGFMNQHFHFATKYLFYESAFFYFLPELKIPSLTFSKTIVTLQIILFFLINLFLASDLSFPLTTILFAAWKKFNSKDLSILGNPVDSSKLDTASHFKGSHTIKILPENTIYLNPFQDSFCLPSGVSKYQLNVPIRLNSTSEIDFLQVKFTDLETNTPTLLNYTKKDIKRFDSTNINILYDRDTVYGPSIHYINLPVKQTGLYEITQALDSKYLSLRNYRSSLIIPNCPTAEISNFAALSDDRCIGDFYSVKFTVEGVPPLKLKYNKFVNRDVQVFSDQSLQPEFYQSPLIGHGGSKVFTKEQLADLSWAKTRRVEVEFDSPVSVLGDYSFRIEEIVDGLGNMVNFTETLDDDDELFRQYNLHQSFYSHDLPKVHLEERVNKNTATKRSLYLGIDQAAEDSPPYEAQIKFVSDDESETKIFTHTFKNGNDEYKVEKPGTYTLVSVRSKYCHCIISGRSSVSLSLPVVPKLHVNSKPITDSCVGQVGLVFDMSFIGTPPFNLRQDVYKVIDGKRQHSHSTKLTSPGTRYRFNYEPSVEGNYEITFSSLVDSLYSDPIELSPSKDYTFTTSMRVKPSAEIYEYQPPRALCLGASARIPILLKGEAPFSLEYDLIETQTNKRIPNSVKDIMNSDYEIVTQEFKVGGEYIVSLTSVEDNSGCLVNLNGADAKITVRREVPSVGFGVTDGLNKIKIKKGETVELPLRLLGEGSFYVEYDFYDVDGNFVTTKSKRFQNAYKTGIEVSEAGIFKLKSVKDSQCQGVVDYADIFEVNYNQIPSISISEHSDIQAMARNVFGKKNVCQYHEDSIDLSLHGSPPFIVEYTVLSPNGARSSRSLSVATKFASLRLLNADYGDYVYFITNVYDALYSKQDLEKIHYSIDEVIVKQSVLPSPRGEFKNKRKSYRTCTTNLLEKDLLDPIKLSLQGNSPYTVTFEIFHESSSKSEFVTLNNVDSSSEFKELYRGLKLGNHLVNIVKIVDSTGCIEEEFPDNNYISISITDTPKITQLDASMNYCVGDHIGYQLIGTPPFAVTYNFNGHTIKSVESSSQFVRMAAEPGVISIESLKDSASNCVVNFTQPENHDQAERLTITVHPIPSVEVSQGDSIIQDIHEGDQAEIIFSFEGTPPFSLTYVRTEQVAGKRGKTRSQVVETHTVSDIYAYEYRVLTSLQGTYEAIEVSDAYCIARNE